MAILNNYKRWKPILVLDNSKYFDTVLSLDNSRSVDINRKLTEKCLISYIDAENSKCIIDNGGMVSLPEYSFLNAISDGVTLEDIGLTGTDNGIIRFDKSTITDEEYISIIQNSELSIESGDTRLYLLPMYGNTGKNAYPCSFVKTENESFYSFNGGFLQGVYKLYGFDYQILPNTIEDAFHFEFVIRPMDYQESGSSLNQNNPNNNGIFFYIGTRSENKFLQFYNYDFSKYPQREDYVDALYSGTTLETSQGNPITNNEYKNIYTDNGYLIYDRTCNGYTVHTWNRGDTLKIQNKYKEYDDNLFLLLNRGCSGYTVSTLHTYSGETHDSKEVIKDIVNNAFALRITDDGRIGYKYLIQDCDSQLGYKIAEEYSFANIVTRKEWNVINVMLKILNGNINECGEASSNRKMKVYIYVNGYLKFVSQELPSINIRELQEEYEKQEMVPFNMSLGGGTVGLGESTWIGSYDGFKYILPIEENFSGSFIGDIKSFKFYNCKLQFNEIKNNYLFEQQKSLRV